jgi:hypothetical protein
MSWRPIGLREVKAPTFIEILLIYYYYIECPTLYFFFVSYFVSF